MVERGKWKWKYPDDIRRDWEARGFTCDIWVDYPGARWENFIHDVDELVCPLDGKMEFEIDGKVYILEPGDECLIPKHTLHSARNRENKIVRWLYGYRKRGK